MASFREKLFTGLDNMIVSLYYSSSIWVLALLISSIINSVWCSLSFDSIWKNIKSTHILRISVTVLAAAGFYSFICVIAILCLIYFIGNNFIPHFSCLFAFILGNVVEVIFLLLSILCSTPLKQKEYRTAFMSLLQTSSPEIIKWMDSVHCNISTCESQINAYVNRRTKAVFYSNSVILGIIIISLIALGLTVLFLASVKNHKDHPVLPEQKGNQKQEDSSESIHNSNDEQLPKETDETNQL